MLSLTPRLATSAILSLALAGVIVTSASAAEGGLTLAPAIAVVPTDQHSLGFLLINSSAEYMHIVVTTSDAWVVPSEKSFDLAPKQRHTTPAAVVLHPDYDAGGDHETDVTFSIPPNGDGTIRISWAIVGRVIIDTGGKAFHNLRVFGLSAPAIADSFDAPNVTITLDNSASNVHQVVDVQPWGQVLLLRGQTKVLSLAWTHHAWIGYSSITAGGQSVSTLFLPIRAAGGLLAILAGLLLLRRVRRT